MNDFHAGRDLTIKDSNITVNQPQQEEEIKPVAFLPTPELLKEREHRQLLAKEEEQARTKHLPKLIVFAIGCMAVTWACQQFDMKHPFFIIVSFVSALASIGSFIIAFKGFENKTEFELRQLQVLKEINMILKERRVEK